MFSSVSRKAPLLFISYINDILTNIESDGYLFADETKIFRIISTLNDSLPLQKDIHSLENWTKLWLLGFNQDKFHILTLGKVVNITHRYKVADYEIEHVFDEKDLGVIFDSICHLRNTFLRRIMRQTAPPD